MVFTSIFFFVYIAPTTPKIVTTSAPGKYSSIYLKGRKAKASSKSIHMYLPN